MAKYNEEEELINIWPSYSDVAFSIVLILVFIIMAQYVVLGDVLRLGKIKEVQNQLSEKLKLTFGKEYGNSIKITKQPQLQKITFSDKILFDAGKADLKPEGQRVLRSIATTLLALMDELKKEDERVFDEIQIRGHTDDRPINTTQFPTNWELSSARATSVVRFFVDECGLRSSRNLLLSAQGYSEYDYIRKNTDETSRALNRRIEIVIKYPLAY